MTHFATRKETLVGTGGTIHVPPSRLVGIKSRAKNGGWGGTVTWSCPRVPGIGSTHPGGTTFLQNAEPFVDGDIVVTGRAGDDVVAHIRF